MPEGAAPPVHIAGGTVLAQRFRVVRFIAAGGMGEVYEANDLELGEVVALKVLRPPGEPDDARSLERFRRETRLARRVTHRNVCRIFDLFIHHDPATGRDVAVLAMELLRGELLSDRIRRLGRLSPLEAQAVVEQLTCGLDAAHAAGVVHRDFKSANVILDTTEDGSLRAVITDFGLAVAQAPEPEITLPGDVLIGTPAYMAPEQVLGHEVTPATDIYALGIVIFEMLTGEQPFAGNLHESLAARCVDATPPSPLEIVPGLDPRWASVISRALQFDPARRFATAAAVRRALDGQDPDSGSGITLPPPPLETPSPAAPPVRRAARVWLASLAAVSVVGVAALPPTIGWLIDRRGIHPAATAPPVAPQSVAVLAFENVSGRAADEWIGRVLVETLETELSTAPGVKVVPGGTVSTARRGLGPFVADGLSADALGFLRAVLPADLIVDGAFVSLVEQDGRAVRVDVRIQRSSDGEILASLSDADREDHLLPLVSRLGGAVRERLASAGR